MSDFAFVVSPGSTWLMAMDNYFVFVWPVFKRGRTSSLETEAFEVGFQLSRYY